MFQKVSIEVSFEPLSKQSDYKDYAILEEIRLCDTVYVEFPELGVSATAKCVKPFMTYYRISIKD